MGLSPSRIAFMFGLRQFRAGSAILTLVTIALFAAALLNLERRGGVALPDDGVTWAGVRGGVEAAHVDPTGPAAQAGLRPGDRVTSIAGRPVDSAAAVARALESVGPWGRADYEIVRDGAGIQTAVILREAPRDRVSAAFQWVLGAVYLVLGGVTFWRAAGRPLVRHFYLFCLGSFVVYAYRYSGELDAFDRFVYWADVWATLLTPALFFHFAAAFPAGRLGPRGRRAVIAAYAAASGLIAFRHLTAAGIVGTGAPVAMLIHLLDRIDYALLGAWLLAAALVLRFGGSANEEPLVKTQRRWLAWGAFWGAVPFCVFYVGPYVAGGDPGPNHTLSIFSLALIPLAFAFSIARHRFMDVDLVVRRGTAYTLATAAALAAFYGGVFVLSGWVEPQLGGLGPASWVASVVAVALLFHPLRSAIQRTLDRYYFQERYDYRRTLADFASELSAETDPGKMLEAVSGRLQQTLALSRLAIFVAAREAGDEPGRFELAYASGFEPPSAAACDTAFLDAGRLPDGAKFLFFDNPARNLEEPGSVRSSVAALGLNHYVPCRVRGRVIAWIGLGLTEEGRYLTSEDLALVRAVSGAFASALENARLYKSLEQKAQQYERLKEYNENIVESLHVGILALDLEDRVEAWNTQLELMFGISRRDAVGQKIEELLPGALAIECRQARGEAGVHNVYKLPLRAGDFPERFRPAAARRSPADDERIFNVAIAPLVSKSFEPIGRLLILEDVTEQIELESQLVQAEKLSSIGLLAAGVAHEVNTPLAVISSYAQMLAKQLEGDAAREKILDKITRQTFRASEIVNSLLNFSRTSSSGFGPVDLNRALRETVDLVQPQLEKAGVRVETQLAEDLPAVRGVANKLQQVLLNLFLNARDAMPDGGLLRIGTRVEERGGEPFVRVSVADSGVGIAREQLAKIFDPFFTTKGPRRGTGLGLAVSYGIVKEHGGTISVDSSPGQGTSFTIDLPLARKPIHA